MPYFPETIMPLSPKQNVPGFVPSNVLVSADDYNLHDGEIRAIEEYLGKSGGFVGLGLPKGGLPTMRKFESDASSSASDQRGTDSELPDPSQGSIVNTVSRLVDIVNNMTDYSSQASSSGYLHSGQRVAFPEQVQATFLANIPGSSDTVINVNSTSGFPRQGVISILNDVEQAIMGGTDNKFHQNVLGGTSTVEWIRYSNKNQTQFLDCERGFLNTNIGPHSASFDPPAPTGATRNIRDFCVLLDGVDTTVCNREWPTWRQRHRYRMPFFSVQGTWRDLVTYIVRYGTRHPLTSSDNAVSAESVIAAADACGLKVEINGVPYLQSQSESNRSKNRIGWVEAETFVKKLQEYGEVVEVSSPEDFTVGTIPVFRGRVAVNYGLSAITRTTTANIDAVQIMQTADSRVYCFLSNKANKDMTQQAIVSFGTYFAGSVMTSELRNNT
jgi:hypothetical protein